MLGNAEITSKLRDYIVRWLMSKRGEWKSNTVIYGRDLPDKMVKQCVASLVVSHELPHRLELSEVEFLFYVAKSGGPEAEPLSVSLRIYLGRITCSWFFFSSSRVVTVVIPKR